MVEQLLSNQLTLLKDKHRPLVSRYLSSFPPEISEHTFTNLFCWRSSRPIYIMELDDTLLFLVQDSSGAENRFYLFGPPVGRLSLGQVFRRRQKLLSGAVRIPAAIAGPLIDRGYSVQSDRSNWDYVYLVQDLAELSGRGYAKKRSQIKKCLQFHNCIYEPITARLLAQCRTMQEQWCAVRSCSLDPGLCSEFQAINAMFDNFEQLDLFGGCIRVDEAVQAFCVAESLTPGTAVIHFEKAMPAIKGLSQLINTWFAQYGLTDFTFVNREQDLGIPGLRQAKKSYLPHHFVEKTTIMLAEESTGIAGSLVHGCAEEEDQAVNRGEI